MTPRSVWSALTCWRRSTQTVCSTSCWQTCWQVLSTCRLSQCQRPRHWRWHCWRYTCWHCHWLSAFFSAQRTLEVLVIDRLASLVHLLLSLSAGLTYMQDLEFGNILCQLSYPVYIFAATWYFIRTFSVCVIICRKFLCRKFLWSVSEYVLVVFSSLNHFFHHCSTVPFVLSISSTMSAVV